MTKKIKRIIIFFFILFLLVLGIVLKIKLYSSSELELKYDVDYYTITDSSDDGKWIYEKTLSGLSYYLFIPTKYKNDRNSFRLLLHSTARATKVLTCRSTEECLRAKKFKT